MSWVFLRSIQLHVFASGLESAAALMFLPRARKPGQRFCVFYLHFRVLLTCLLRYIFDTCVNLSLRWGGGGGVGRGAMTCTVLAHMFDATQLHLHTCWGWGGCGGVQWHALYLHTWSMLRNCTCAHVPCYANALAHMFDATPMHLHTCSMLRKCTCTHVRCYANALAHMFDATPMHYTFHGRSSLLSVSRSKLEHSTRMGQSQQGSVYQNGRTCCSW